MPSSLLRFSLSSILLLGAAAGCGPSDAHVATKFASDFTPQRRSVSVLGVFKDGQMSADAWTTIAGTRVAPSARGIARATRPTCAVGYTETLQSTNGEADSSAIDAHA